MALAFAGKVVATSAISTIVGKSFDYLEKYMKEEGMQSVKERLERTLPRVQVVFDAVDTEQIKEQSVALDAWLWQFRDAVEDAEDVLDEVEYYNLEKKVKSRGSKVRKSLYKCKRTCIQQFSTTFKVGIFKRMLGAMKKLDEVAVGVEPFLLVVDRLDSRSLRHSYHHDTGNPRETSSFPADDNIIGRDAEKNQIVKWLIKMHNDDQDVESRNVTTFAIVGIGGLGKTTLAQTVYHEQDVKQSFDQTLWVCVSNDFDVHTLTRKIIQEISGQRTNITSLNTLQETLKGKLSSTKFLLVLDDVWNDKRIGEWEKLLTPLKFGQKGSKILMTTRMQSVVDTAERALGEPIESLKLEGLQENDLLKLFNRHAFFGVNPGDYTNLQEIGKQIAKKLSRNPLAAKVMGGLLNNTMDIISWNRILRENISNIEHGDDGVMKILGLSYQHLLPELQACFRFCSLFREDYTFHKDELINLWMGSGLIQTSVDEHKSPEDVGEDYLHILIRKSFFEVRYWPSSEVYGYYKVDSTCYMNYSNEYYVMHDLLHALAQTVSKKECVRTSCSKYGTVPGTVRHLNLYIENHALVTDFSRLKKLRTLLISFDERVLQKDQWNVLKKVLNEATKLRALEVKSWVQGVKIQTLKEDAWIKAIDLPIAFDKLIHLRYLSYSSLSGSVWIPTSVCNLYHLQLVKIDNFLWKSCQLINLVNLRKLYYSSTESGPPPHIGELTCLRDLHVSLKHERISALKELVDLHYLSIHDIQDDNVEEAKCAKLAEKEHLIELSLSWYDKPWKSERAEEYLDNLQPPRNLSKLTINGYRGSRSPFWMENPVISNLTYVSILDCVKWQNLPPLGCLPSLVYLSLRDMHAVKRIDKSFYGRFGFPTLKLLSFETFPALEEWAEIEGGNMFPHLKTLFIKKCSALRNVPALPCSLVDLDIEDIGFTNFPASYQPSGGTAQMPKSSPSKLRISGCPNLLTLKQEHYFFGLEELYISNCQNLLNLSMDLQTLPFLKSFRLENCPNLMTPQATLCLPLSIHKILIGSCGGYENYLVNSLRTLISLTTLKLHNCVMTTLPYDVFMSLKNVQQLKIVRCRELAALDGLEKLISLRELRISECGKLGLASLDGLVKLISLRELIITECDKLEKYLDMTTEQVFPASDVSQGTAICPSHLGKLKKLRISSPFLLQWELLRRVNSVTHLTIDKSHRCLPEEWLMQNRNHLKHLGVLNATHLEFLPSTMASLTSLETLSIHRAALLQSLPELPASLEALQIFECHPVLERRCRKRKGSDWHKIERITDLEIVQGRPSSYTIHYYDDFYHFFM